MTIRKLGLFVEHFSVELRKQELKRNLQMHRRADSDGPGLDFSGFGRARAFMYRASGGPGFFVSGFGLFSGFSKV